MEGRGGLSGNVADEAFCLKSARVFVYILHSTKTDSASTRRACEQSAPEKYALNGRRHSVKEVLLDSFSLNA